MASIAELRPALELFAARYLQRGFQPPKLWYTDMCCGDRALLQNIFSSIESESNHTAVSQSVPPTFGLLKCVGGTVLSTSSTQLVARACRDLEQESHLKRDLTNKQSILGVSMDWNVSDCMEPKLLSLALSTIGGNSFQFNLNSPFDSLPKALLLLLADNNILKVGADIEWDASLFRRSSSSTEDYAIRPTDTLHSAAQRHLKSNVASDCTIQTLSARLLERQLPPKLFGEADSSGRVYAFASALVYGHTLARADPIYRPGPATTADIPTDTSLRLYDFTNTECVAIGTAVDYSSDTWGLTGIRLIPARQGTRATAVIEQRIVVKLTQILVPGAVIPYKLAQDQSDRKLRHGTTLSDAGVDTAVLWNTVCSLDLNLFFELLNAANNG